MKITREQIEKINSRMGNGWSLDLHYLMLHGEKTAEMNIPQADGGYIHGAIYIDKVCDWRPNAYNGIQIKIHVHRYYKGNADGIYTASGLGYWKEINRPDLKRAMFSEVEKLTHEITAADIAKMYAENKAKIHCARII